MKILHNIETRPLWFVAIGTIMRYILVHITIMPESTYSALRAFRTFAIFVHKTDIYHI